MLIRYCPAPPLNAAIDCIWLSRRVEHAPECEHMLPSGKAQLVVTLHDSPIQWAAGGAKVEWHAWTGGVIHGPQSRYYLAGPKPPGVVLGASFRPGMAAAVLGVPLYELRDRHVSIEELWGYRGLELHDRLASIHDPQAVCRALEAELIARIRRPLLIHPAVAQALLASGSNLSPRVADVQRHSGYSPRHFIELFHSAVGLTPKHYYRVRRFSDALARLARGDAKLADVAFAAGYADQAHFSREFRDLAGVSPSIYRPRAADSEHHHVVGLGKKTSRLSRRPA
ncbi:helix-turn-helix transcriptional regulator [Steroidobacter sp.]|uniref:helix-turn-helix transcriptional regulator n=1 Tax=Steroidobacter sp. TaxID=1978227 RepID=UPI001A506850|nr:helix-turn-helix transcriptional regulator [Steroidobacter sp.]MBL8266179.1 helix-turn-helix transcriptional regulator [Steroidobacter sp.]